MTNTSSISDQNEALERRLDEADRAAETDSRRFTADEIFNRIKRRIQTK